MNSELDLDLEELEELENLEENEEEVERTCARKRGGDMQYVNTIDACKITGLSYSVVRRLIVKKQLKGVRHYRMGKRYFFNKEDLCKWLDDQIIVF